MSMFSPSARASYALDVLTFCAIMASLMGLVLLMTWMTTRTATFPGPQVKLPEFKDAFDAMPLEEPKSHIVLTITRNAQFFVDNKPVLAENLESDLQSRKTQAGDLIVFLKADQSVPFKWIIWASLQLKRLGIEWIGLIVYVNEKPHERIVGLRLPNWSVRPPNWNRSH